MVNILRVTARWSGFVGAPGYTVLHFRDFGTGDGPGGEPDAAQALAAAERARTFFASVATLLPNSVTIQVQSEVDMLEDTTGQLQDSFSVAPPAVVTGTGGTGGYAAAAGAVVNWRTASFRNGRRIRGRTFLVPLAGGSYQSDGTLNDTFRTTLVNAAQALTDSAGSPDLGVYSRPTAVGTDGRWVIATGSTVPDMAAMLTSRRD